MGSIDINKALDPLGLFTKEKTPEVKTTDPVQQDQAAAQADELLRKRQRQGVNANMLTGPSGDTSSSSTGQKTLLGG
ncbi:hypothetical protein [Yokenella regensburgei]|uniref:hypothetical protein n=1 Tax=Yokenella regensburgei TaxID=158877 RepID=UPI001432FE9D|nr:hypothetical protein [Yokenella regensburgei]QIU92142.1 hypothetical protein HEC60_23850 [Yokenella regensburgei]